MYAHPGKSCLDDGLQRVCVVVEHIETHGRVPCDRSKPTRCILYICLAYALYDLTAQALQFLFDPESPSMDSMGLSPYDHIGLAG